MRSLLFTPGNQPSLADKAFAAGADAVILDLEDSCAVGQKAQTRATVVAALERPRTCRGYVRVNSLKTQFFFDDISAVVRASLDGIVLPKVEHPNELHTAERLIQQFERERGLRTDVIDVIPIIETAIGLAEVDAIASAGTRVRRLALGAGDLRADLRLGRTADEAELHLPRSMIVLASRAAGLESPIDAVWNDLADREGLRCSALRARSLGFEGKLCIHPHHVSVINELFTPTAAEIQAATQMLEAFAAAQERGSAAIRVSQRLVDYASVRSAERILALAQRIDSQRLSGRPE